MISAPYPGLRPFQEEDRDIFFGREAQTIAVLALLQERQFVAVVGSSGSGKSSLVLAGVIPAIREGFLRGTREWKIVKVRPGHDPCGNLARALKREGMNAPARVLPALAAGDTGDPRDQATPPGLDQVTAAILQALHASDRSLIDIAMPAAAAVRAISLPTPALASTKAAEPASAVGRGNGRADGNDDDEEDAHGPRMLLLVDQFEELFTFRRAEGDGAEKTSSFASRDEAATFVRLLLCAAESSGGRIAVVITMRSDFIGDCDAFLGLPELVSRCQFLVPRLDRGQMREAIERPGQMHDVGYAPFHFEEGLVNRIITDARDRLDQLPLMQHALLRIWKIAGGPKAIVGAVLGNEHYETVGRIDGALSLDAERAWVTIENDPAKTRLTQRIFMLLSDVYPDGKIVRRRPLVSQVLAVTGATPEAIEEIVRLFQNDDRNFLLPILQAGEHLHESDRLDVRHEAIFRQWSRIEAWRQQEQESLVWLRELAEAARDLTMQKTSEWEGPDLENALIWEQSEGPNQAWAARHGLDWEACADFLRKSVKKRDRLVREELERQADEKRKAREEAVAKEAQERQKRELRAHLEKLAGILAVLFVAFGITASILWWKAANAKDAAEKAQLEAVDKGEQLKSVLDVLEADTRKAITDIRKALTNTVESAIRAEKQLADAVQARTPADPAAVELDRYLRNADDQLHSFQDLSREKSKGSDGATSSVLADLAKLYKDAQPDVDQAEKQLNAIKAAPSLKAYVERVIEQHAEKTRVEIAKANGVMADVEARPSHQAALQAVAAVAVAEIANSELQSTDKILLFAHLPPGTGTLQIAAVQGEMVNLRARLDKVPTVAPPPAQLDEWTIAARGGAVKVLKHAGAVNWLEFFPPGGTENLLATAGEDGFVTVWNGKGETVFSKPAASGKQGVNAVAVSPGGNWVAAASNGSTVRIYDLSKNPRNPPATAFEGHSDSITSVQFNPAGVDTDSKTCLIASASADRTVRVFRAADARPVRTSGPYGGIVTFVRFSPDGNILVSSCDDNSVRFQYPNWSDKDDRVNLLATAKLAAPARRANFSGDGKWVVVSALKSSYVRSVPAEPAGIVVSQSFVADHPEAAMYSTFRPTASGVPEQVVTCCANGQIRFWSFRKEKEAVPMDLTHRGRALFADWSTDGRWLVTCGDDGSFILWDCRGEKPIPRVKGTGHTKRAAVVRLSPDTAWVATAGDDNQAVLWDVSQLTLSRPLGNVWLEFGVIKTSRDASGNWQKQEEANWKKLNDRFPEFIAAARQAGIPGTDQMKIGRWIIDLVDPKTKTSVHSGPQHAIILEPGFETMNNANLRKLNELANQLKFGTTPSPEGTNPQWKFLEKLE